MILNSRQCRIERYFTECRIVELREVLTVKPHSTLNVSLSVHDHGDYVIRCNERGAAAYLHGQPVASMGSFRYLCVDPAHRGKGLATAMIVALWRTVGDAWRPPVELPCRTVGGAAAYRKAWEMIK